MDWRGEKARSAGRELEVSARFPSKVTRGRSPAGDVGFEADSGWKELDLLSLPRITSGMAGGLLDSWR